MWSFSKLVLLTSLFAKICCECRQSFMTKCDDLKDLRNYYVANISDLIIGSEHSATQYSASRRLINLENFEKLTTLIIFNQINDVEPYVFTTNSQETRLKHLKIYGNDIRSLRPNSFDNLLVERLSFVNNKLEFIHKGGFTSCEIKTIDLSFNNLRIIEENIFGEDNLGNYTSEMILTNNKIKEIQPSSLNDYLEILNLDYNELSSITEETFENLFLKEFSISHNKLTKIPPISKMEELQFLDVSHNLIQEIHPKSFKGLSHLSAIDLSHNKIQQIQLIKFPGKIQFSIAFNLLVDLDLANFEKHVLILYGNPWSCKCWKVMEKTMMEKRFKRDECDLSHFGSGDAPFCVNFEGEVFCNGTEVNRHAIAGDVENFLEAVGQSNERVQCYLRPKGMSYY